MSLNFGDVTFGLGADTAGLKKAAADLNSFGKIVTQAAASQAQGAQAVTRALNAQEKAARSGLNEAVKLQNQLRAAGAPATELARVTRAFQSLNNAMTSGQINMVQFTRANDRFRIQMDKIKTSMGNITPPTDKMNKFKEVLKNLQQSAVLANGPLGGLSSRLTALSSIANRSTIMWAGVAAGVVGVGVGFAKLATAGIQASMTMQRINAQLGVATGSVLGTGQAFTYVTDVSRKFGLSLADTAEQYAKLSIAAKGTSLEGQKTNDIFEGIAVASRAMNLSAADSNGAFLAIQQMMSKGIVQAEELRGQLGDRLPGAFNFMAKAMNVSTAELNKMLKAGKVLSADALPKLAKVLTDVFGLQAAESAKGLAAGIENLKTSVFLFNVEFDKTTGISQAVNEAVRSLTATIDFMTKNMSAAGSVVSGLTGLVIALGGAFFVLTGGVGAVVAGLAAIAAGGTLLAGALTKTNSAWITQGVAIENFIETNKKVKIATDEQINGAIKLARNTLLAASAEQILTKAKMDGMDYWDQFANAADITGARTAALTKRMQENAQIIALTKKQIEDLQGQLGSGPKASNDNEGAAGMSNSQEKAMQRALDMYTKVQEKIEALQGGPESMKDFDRWKSAASQLSAYRNALISAGVAHDTVNKKVDEFGKLLEVQMNAEKNFSETTKQLTEMAGSWFDSLSSDLDGLRKGTVTVSEAFGNMIDKIISDLQRFMLEQMVVAPFKELLGSVMGSVGSSLFGSGGSSSTFVGSGNGQYSNSWIDWNAPGRAIGGNMTAGKPYTVQDTAETEIFVPRSSGKMLSGANLGGDVNIVINNNVGAKVTQKEQMNGNKREVQIDLDEMMAGNISAPNSKAGRAIDDRVKRGMVGR